jgi:ABC-type transport system substrate-binding protein
LSGPAVQPAKSQGATGAGWAAGWFQSHPPLHCHEQRPRRRYPEPAQTDRRRRGGGPDGGCSYVAEESKPLEQSTTELLISNWSPSTGDADWALRSIYSKTSWPPSGPNYGYYFNQQVEDLIMHGLQFTEETKRKDVYAKAQEMIMEDAPNVFLYAPTYFSAIRDNVGGVFLQPDGIPYLRTAHYTS